MALNFDIKLGDQVSPAAKSAASALTQLDSAIKQESASLKALENHMRALEKTGSVNIESGRKLTQLIDSQKIKIGGLTQNLIAAGGAGFVPVKEKAEAAAKAVASIKTPKALKAAKKDGDALKPVMQSLANETGLLGKTLGALGPKGTAAAAALGGTAIVVAGLAAAFIGVAGAVVYLESKLLSLGIQASEAKGDITRSLELLYGGEKAAEHTYQVLESLTGSVAISQDRVMELADHLIKAGQVNGDAMVASIAAIGKAEAARKGAGQVLEGVITRASTSRMFSISRQELRSVGLSYSELAQQISKGTGRAVGEVEIALRTGGVRATEGLTALNKVVDEKLGALANKKLQTVGVQTQRLKDNFMRLFEGFDTGPVARALMAIGNLLDANTTTGAALRTTLKSAFDEVSKAIEFATPYVQDFFETGELLALKFYNALYPVRKSLKKLFGGDDSKGLESFQDSTMAFAEGLGKAFTVAGKAIAWIIDHIKELSEAASIASTITGSAIPGANVAKSAVSGLLGLVASNDNSEAAKKSGGNVADGVAQGIRDRTPAVEAAMATMGEKGVKAFDAKMQIHSPSKVMQLRGRFIDEGTAKGVTDNAGTVSNAMAKVDPGSPKVGATQRASGGGIVIHVTFQAGAIQGVSDVGALKSQLTELMADVFQQSAAMQGAG